MISSWLWLVLLPTRSNSKGSNTTWTQTVLNRSADYIFVRKAVYKMYDLKTISGTGSIGSRLEESIGQTNRVFLNLATTYPTNRMATEIKQYFEANNEAFEVLIAVGKKMVSVERYMVSERNFYKEFRKRIEQ